MAKLKSLKMKQLIGLQINLVFLLFTVATAFSVIKPMPGILKVHKTGLTNEENGLELDISGSNGPPTHGVLGLSLPSVVGEWDICDSSDPSVWLCVQWGDYAQILLKSGRDPNRCTRVEWTSTHAREIEDCYDLDSQVHWYGGGEMFSQVWPINTRSIPEAPYIDDGEFTGIVENYWLLSSGAALVIDPDTPLHFSLNSTHPNRVCFKAKDTGPFTPRSPLKMGYEWCTGSDVKDVHKFVMSTFFDKPTGIPDEEMLIRPFWSTWAEYKTDVNQTIVLDYAKKVVSEGFGNSSHIEIDDKWEECYGQHTFDPIKFPDPKAMVDEIKDMNMRVTLWAHPFVNFNCPLFNEGFEKGYFVKTPKGKTGITSWWQGENAGAIDTTNPEAMKWWSDRLRKIQAETGMDSFKFDAGDTFYLPSASTFYENDASKWPFIYTTRYVETCATFGGLIETRTAHLNQKQPIFIRMFDKASSWGYNNGLKSIIPVLLYFSTVGYPFVLPDMIGGNAHGEPPSKELYIRWMQANIFMPAVQFSIGPWKFDEETVQLCQEVLALREKYRDVILAAARQVVSDGSPMNRPMWWEDPLDPVTFTIDDAYMLGDMILVAPVLEEGAVSRDIYLPVGNWTSGLDSSAVYTGPQWLRDFPAPLHVVPFFVKST